MHNTYLLTYRNRQLSAHRQNERMTERMTERTKTLTPPVIYWALVASFYAQQKIKKIELHCNDCSDICH